MSRWAIALPALALIIGLVLGGVLVGVAQDGNAPTDQVQRESPSPTNSPSASPGGGTAVIAPDSCLQAAETVREAVDRIRGGIESIREFRAEEIILLLNDLEDLDALARQQAATCSGTTITDVPLEASSPTQEPTP